MALYEVGQVGVRVRPLTDKFSAELNSKLTRIERSLEVSVKIKIDESSFRAAEAKIKSLGNTEIKVTADLSRADVSGLDRSLKNASASVSNLDGVVGQVTTKLDGLDSQKIVLDADTQALHNKLMGLKFPKPIEAPIKLPDSLPDTNRSIPGLNLIPNFKMPNFGPLITNLAGVATQAAIAGPAIVGVTAAIGGLGIALAGVIGPLFSLASSLGPIVGLGLVLPAMIGGLIPLIATIAMVAMDAGTELGDLALEFSELQQSVSFAFWDHARDAIYAIVDAVMPLAMQYLPQVAIGLAGWVQNIAGVLTSVKGLENMNALFSNVAIAVDMASVGVASFFQGLLTLAGAGSVYLPIMTEQFNQLGIKFDLWTRRIVADGSFQVFVSNAVTVLQSLFSIVGSLVGIIGSIGTAAQSAGHLTVQSLAGGFAQVDAALKTEAWQARMTTFFQVTNAGMAVISGALGGLIIQLASMGTLFTAFTVNISAAVAALVTGLTVALQNVQTQANFVLFFQQIAAAATALAPAINPVLQIISTALTVIGAMIVALAPLFTTFFGGMTGSFTALGVALQPVIQALGVTLNGALLILMPLFQILVGTILPALALNFQSLLGVVQPIANLLAAILGPALQLVATWLQMAAPLVSMVAGYFATWLGILTPVVSALMGSLVPVLSNLARAIMPVLMQAVTQIGDSFTVLLRAIAPVVTALVTGLGPVLQWLVPFIVGIATSILGNVVGAFQGLVNVIVGVVNTVSAVFRGDWAAAWDGLKQIVSGAVQLIWNLVQLWMWGKLLSLFRSTISGISSVWTTGWNGIKTFVSNIWTGIKSIITGGLNAARSIISSVMSGIKNVWTSTWTGIKTVASSIWNGLKAVVSGGLSFIRSTITSILTAIRTSWTNTWNAIKTAVSNVWNAIKTAVSNGFNAVMKFFREFPGKALGTLKAMIGQAKTVGTNIMNGLKDGVVGAAQGVIQAVSGTVKDAIGKAKSLLGIHSPSRVFRQLGVFMDRGWENGIDAEGSRVANAVSRVSDKAVAAAPASVRTDVGASYSENRGAVNNYYLNLDVKDLEGLRVIEELSETIRLRARMAGKDI